MSKIIGREELRIRQWNAGLTMSDVAEIIGVKQPVYRLIAIGAMMPTKEQADKLNELFELPENYFAETFLPYGVTFDEIAAL